MPAVLQQGGFHFFFCSLDLGEPSHIHVVPGSKVAKY